MYYIKDMNKRIFILIFLSVLLVVAIIITILTNHKGGIDLPSNDLGQVQPEKQEVYTDFNTQVVPSKDINKTTIPTSKGAVKPTDVRKLPEISPLGDGVYSLEGTRSDKSAGFSMVYYEMDNSYSIAVLNEPIAENREAASKYFLEVLQISEADACKLKVYIGTTYDVNQELSGQNLGLSFCPGAVKL